MTKVILDFQELKDHAENESQLQNMTELAKEAKGFVFFIDRGESSGLQIACLNAISLAGMISQIYESHPQVRMLVQMHDMMSGGKVDNPFGNNPFGPRRRW